MKIIKGPNLNFYLITCLALIASILNKSVWPMVAWILFCILLVPVCIWCHHWLRQDRKQRQANRDVQGYVQDWEFIMKGLLGWDSNTVQTKMVEKWNSLMKDKDSMFYHEPPLYYCEPYILMEWINEAKESIREGKGYNHQKLAASQIGEIFTPLRSVEYMIYRKNEQPNWDQIRNQIKENLRNMPPYQEWKLTREPEVP